MSLPPVLDEGTFIGIDLGGTKIAAAAVDVGSGALAGRLVVPTESQNGPDAVLSRMAALVHEVCRSAVLEPGRIGGLGVGVPGLFDGVTGETQFLPNLTGGWRGVPLALTLRQAVGLPVWLINDARAFILAEARLGAGRGEETAVGITLGTGIGGGFAVGGRVHLGLAGMAGEIGHMTVQPHGELCVCGNQGCLETLASGPSITAMGIRAVVQGHASRIGSLAGNELSRITPQVIRQAAEDGDMAARRILEQAGWYLGICVANLITVLSPNCVILGGSVASLGEWIFAPVRTAVSERVRTIPTGSIRIVSAELRDAGIIGAALWAAHQNHMP